MKNIKEKKDVKLWDFLPYLAVFAIIVDVEERRRHEKAYS